MNFLRSRGRAVEKIPADPCAPKTSGATGTLFLPPAAMILQSLNELHVRKVTVHTHGMLPERAEVVRVFGVVRCVYCFDLLTFFV